MSDPKIAEAVEWAKEEIAVCQYQDDEDREYAERLNVLLAALKRVEELEVALRMVTESRDDIAREALRFTPAPCGCPVPDCQHQRGLVPPAAPLEGYNPGCVCGSPHCEDCGEPPEVGGQPRSAHEPREKP